MAQGTALEVPRWRSALNVLGVLAGLLLLAGLSMGLILFVAKLFEKRGAEPPPPAIFIDLSTSRPGEAARARTPLPNGLDDLPGHPGRGVSVNLKSGRASSGTATSAPAGRAAVPVGLSADEYHAAVASGKKVYLHDPRGECALGGEGGLAGALTACFAPRAAR